MALTGLRLDPAGALIVVCLILLSLLLMIAAVGDLRKRRISNGLCVAIAVLAIPFWILSAPDLVGRTAIQLALWIAGAPVLVTLFAYRAMGGGDVKLIAALLLWLPPREALTFFIVMALSGGAIAILTLLTARPGLKRPSVPYGIAIAIGGLAFAYTHLATMIRL